MAFHNPLYDAWESHREVPFRLNEIWTRDGRQRHLVRWRAARASLARAAARDLGIRWPSGWTDVEISRTCGVLSERIYDVPGFVPNGGLVVDVGMSVGDYTVLSALRGARVYGFEPLLECVALAEALVRENGVSDRVRIFPVALGESARTTTVRVEAGMAMAGASPGGRSVPFERLDDALREVPERVGILKIDVEGFEASVLRGSLETIRRSRPRVVIEVHGKAADQDVAKLLGSLGYRRVAADRKRLSTPFGYVRNEFWSSSDETPGAT